MPDNVQRNETEQICSFRHKQIQKPVLCLCIMRVCREVDLQKGVITSQNQ